MTGAAPAVTADARVVPGRRQARVALFIPALDVGGAERAFVTLANGLSRAGCLVDVVVVRGGGRLHEEIDSRVRVVDLDAKRTAFSLLPLIRYLRRARPEALLSTLADANAVGVLARAVARVPLRVVVREACTPSVHNSTTRGLRLRALAATLTRTYRAADRVVSPSRGVAEDLIAEYGIPREHVAVIANPVDFGRIRTLAGAGEGDREAQPIPMVLGVGRLSAQKDFATLIRAFAHVRRTMAARLVILGEGDERNQLEGLIESERLEEDVRLPGWVENPFSYMREAAVYVLSSRYEGLPNTLLQALAVGTPAVATDCQSGPREILDGGRWGRLVPVADVNAMTAAILDGVGGAIETVPLAILEQRYGIEKIAREYLDVLCA